MGAVVQTYLASMVFNRWQHSAVGSDLTFWSLRTAVLLPVSQACCMIGWQDIRTSSQQMLEMKPPSQQASDKPPSQHKLDTKPPSQQALITETPSQQAAEAQPPAQPSTEIRQPSEMEQISSIILNDSILEVKHHPADNENMDDMQNVDWDNASLPPPSPIWNSPSTISQAKPAMRIAEILSTLHCTVFSEDLFWLQTSQDV